MERVLIAGGAGFLGSHLCERLLAEEYEVLCVDNLSTGSQENIDHLRTHPHFTFLKRDVIEPLEIEDALSRVLHFASPASPKDYLKYPIETLRAGAFGTHQLLELALSNHATFLLASSSEVYGDPVENPQVESYWGHVNPIGPRSVYDESKRFAEALTMAYHRQYRLDVKIARIFNTYGPRMQIEDGRVIPNFMSQALLHKPLTVYGTGTQTRSLCYVSDLVDGIYKLLHSDVTGPINLGNPDEVQIIDLAKEILQLTGSQSSISYQPLPEDDPQVRCPDTSQAERLLGWRSKVSRKEGLQCVIPYFQEKLKVNHHGRSC